METRYSELRAEGTGLSGILMAYGDTATLPWGRERFEVGAFEYSDVILNAHHDRAQPLARTGAGLELHDGPDALRMTATLPDTALARDTLTLVRSGVLRGLSVEFQALEERQDGGLRIIERASLSGLGIVDRPAYADSVVQARMEVRQTGKRRIEGAFFYEKLVVVDDGGALQNRLHHNTDEPVTRRKVRPGAFAKSIQDDDVEQVLLLGNSYDNQIASKKGKSLVLTDSPDSLTFSADLPDIPSVDEFLTKLDAGAISPGVRMLYRISPIDDAVDLVPDGEDFVETVNDALLTAISIANRPPRGNEGSLSVRQRRRWY